MNVADTTEESWAYRFTTHLLKYPSRLLARIRRLDEFLNDNVITETHAYATTNGETMRRQRLQNVSAGLVAPGPWGFVTSGYFYGLMIMAFVLNRIQNIVVPPHRQLGFRIHGVRNSRLSRSLHRLILNSFLPLDLTSTFCRSVFRVPSLYLLGKCLLLWFVVLLQSTELFPSWNWGWLQSLDAWVAQKQMEDICWFTFTTTCVALAVGALTNGLEGLNSSNSTPFNLFSFAFQLYMYASPATHVNRADNRPSRPDKHIIITIMVPLLQLALLHALEIKQRWSRQRLIPTTLCATLTLIHFHSVVWTSPSSYPLTNYVPCGVDSILIGMILITVFLNSFTQLLLEGAITQPLFGHAATLMPRWDEDFTVVLFRLGTASLEATNVAGLGNEVGSVTSVDSTDITRHFTEDAGTVEVDRAGVVTITPAFERDGAERRPKHGFANEITNVKATTRQTNMWVDNVMSTGWHTRELWLYAVAMWKVLKSIAQVLWAKLQQRFQEPIPTRLHPLEGVVTESSIIGYYEGPEAEPDIYERFLRGEALSESDDEDFELPDDADDLQPNLSDDEADTDEDERPQLWADLGDDSVSPSMSPPAPLLMAHMISPSTLTRRRYHRLVAGPSASDGAANVEDWDEIARETRDVKRAARRAESDDVGAESRQNCVICTVEPRNIICWPCRCLVLCDDCRENLASRSSASKHTCPCCRRSVEGYSRIYIP